MARRSYRHFTTSQVALIKRPQFEENRLLSGARGHLRGEIVAAPSLVPIQSAPPALESPRSLLSDPPGDIDRRRQEINPNVLSELRVLASADFDSRSRFPPVILSGDGRFPELLRQEDSSPWGAGSAHDLSPSPLRAKSTWSCSGTALSKAGNATLMTDELMQTMVDRRSGNHRLLMIMGSEFLAHGMAPKSGSLTRSVTWKCISRGGAPRPRKKRGCNDGNRSRADASRRTRGRACQR